MSRAVALLSCLALASCAALPPPALDGAAACRAYRRTAVSGVSVGAPLGLMAGAAGFLAAGSDKPDPRAALGIASASLGLASAIAVIVGAVYGSRYADRCASGPAR